MLKFEIRMSNGLHPKPYFVLKSPNGKTIAVSELYESKQACRKGISAVKKSFFSTTVDLSE